MSDPACRLCGASAAKFLFRALPVEVDIYACQACGFRFNGPSEDAPNEDCDGLEMAVLRDVDHRRSLWRAKARLRTLQRYVARGALLEIGCGGGEFLAVAKAAGFERCFGVEPARCLEERLNALKDTPGIGVHLGDLDSAMLPAEAFDAVVAFHVVEHVTEPVALMRDVYRVLKPGGHCLFSMPNVDSWQAKIFGPRFGFYSRGHVNSFGPLTLRRLLESQGLRVVDLWTYDQGYLLGDLLTFWIRRALVATCLKGLTWAAAQQAARAAEAGGGGRAATTVGRIVHTHYAIERAQIVFNKTLGFTAFPLRIVQNRCLAGIEVNVVAVKDGTPGR